MKPYTLALERHKTANQNKNDFQNRFSQKMSNLFVVLHSTFPAQFYCFDLFYASNGSKRVANTNNKTIKGAIVLE